MIAYNNVSTKLINDKNSICIKPIELKINNFSDGKKLNETNKSNTNLPDNNSSWQLINNEILYEDKETMKKKMLRIIEDSDYEWGELSQFDRYLMKRHNDKRIIEILNEIFLEHLDDENIIVKIFRAFSKISYDETYPNAQTMCIAAFSLNNVAITEVVVELFETWRNDSALNILKQLNNIEAKWLKQYIDDVIKELEEELDISEKIC